jgi:hypothetical protein
MEWNQNTDRLFKQTKTHFYNNLMYSINLN